MIEYSKINCGSQPVISVKFSYEMIGKKFKYVSQFPAMNEIPPSVTGHLNLPRNPLQRIPINL